MAKQVYVYDPTANDQLSKVRGVGRYLQILRENFPKWKFVSNITIQQYNNSVFLNPFFNFLQPPLTLKRLAKKHIAVIHDLIPLKYSKYFPSGIKGRLNVFLNKFALKNYDLIVTDSHASKKDIIKLLKIKEEKIKVIYPCLPKKFTSDSPLFSNDNEALKQYDNLTNLNQYCLYVGDATWNKNLVNLAKAIKEIDVTCVFVGKVFHNQSSVVSNQQKQKTGNRQPITDNYRHPWQKELREFYKEIEGDKRFIFKGFVSDNELIQLYKNARCNILVSKDEGFGFSYLEAASQTCCSVLSNIQTLREVSKNKGALFVKPDQPIDIANALGEVYFNQELRNKLGNDAKDRLRYFSQKKFVAEFTKILDL